MTRNCCNVPHSSTLGLKPPRQTAWYAILVILGLRKDQ